MRSGFKTRCGVDSLARCASEERGKRRSPRLRFGLVLVFLGLMFCTTAAGGAATPMPRPIELEGLHAYAEKSIAAGEMIPFRVSSTVPYELSVCRLGWKVDDPAGDEVLVTFPKSPAVRQHIHPGSFVHVEKPLPADRALDALTLECWVRPWGQKSWQSLITQHDYPKACGFGLFLDGEGLLQFYLGDGGEYRKAWAHAGPQLERLRWHHVVGTWDGKTKSLWVDGKCVGEWPFPGPVKPVPAALRPAAEADNRNPRRWRVARGACRDRDPCQRHPAQEWRAGLLHAANHLRRRDCGQHDLLGTAPGRARFPRGVFGRGMGSLGRPQVPDFAAKRSAPFRCFTERAS